MTETKQEHLYFFERLKQQNSFIRFLFFIYFMFTSIAYFGLGLLFLFIHHTLRNGFLLDLGLIFITLPLLSVVISMVASWVLYFANRKFIQSKNIHTSLLSISILGLLSFLYISFILLSFGTELFAEGPEIQHIDRSKNLIFLWLIIPAMPYCYIAFDFIKGSIHEKKHTIR